MNSKALTLALTLLLAACLASCASSSSSGGQVINYPTVDDMARYESQWGMQPRQIKPRLRQAEPGDMIAPSASAPASLPAAPAPAPLKELPSE
ncbi:MAG: hypothetical protein RL693_1106, partial [Verrucomicrobiota bacterium]